MEKCKFCQADLEENSSVCPSCGADNAEVATVETPQPVEEMTAPEETTPVQDAPAAEMEEAQEKPAAEQAKKAVSLK